MFHNASTLLAKLLRVHSLARTRQALSERNYTLPIINFQHVAARTRVLSVRAESSSTAKICNGSTSLIKLGTLTEPLIFC